MAASSKITETLLHRAKKSKRVTSSDFVVPTAYHKHFHQGNRYISKSGAKKLAYLKSQLEKVLYSGALNVNESEIKISDRDKKLYNDFIALIDSMVISGHGHISSHYFESKGGPIGLITTFPSLHAFKIFLETLRLFNKDDLSKLASFGNSLVSLFSTGNIIDKSIQHTSTTLGVCVKLFNLIEVLSTQATLHKEAMALLENIQKMSLTDLAVRNKHLITFKALLNRVQDMPIVSFYEPFENILKNRRVALGPLAMSRQMYHLLKVLAKISTICDDDFKVALQMTAEHIHIRPEMSGKTRFHEHVSSLKKNLKLAIREYHKHSPHADKLAILVELQENLNKVAEVKISEQLNSILQIITQAYQANISLDNADGQRMLPGRTGEIIANVYTEVMAIFPTRCLEDDADTKRLVDTLRMSSTPQPSSWVLRD